AGDQQDEEAKSHCCPARSLRLGAPARSAAPRSRVALVLAFARGLIVVPPARFGSALRLARLRLARGSRWSSPSLAGSSQRRPRQGLERRAQRVGDDALDALHAGRELEAVAEE